MSGVQGSLLEPEASAPAHVAEFFAGFVSAWTFGEKPSTGQRRQASAVGRELADAAARFRAGEVAA